MTDREAPELELIRSTISKQLIAAAKLDVEREKFQRDMRLVPYKVAGALLAGVGLFAVVVVALGKWVYGG